MAPAVLSPAASIRPAATATASSSSAGGMPNHHPPRHPSKRPASSSSSAASDSEGYKPYQGPYPVFQPTDEILATYQSEFRITRTILPLQKQPDVAPFLIGRLERNFKELMDNSSIREMVMIESGCKTLQVVYEGPERPSSSSSDSAGSGSGGGLGTLHVIRIVAEEEEAARLADQMVVHFLRHGDPRMPFNGFVVCPLHVLGAVIGLKGAAIRPLQDRLDVDVRSPPRDEAEGAINRALLIKGKAHNDVLQALKEVEESISREKEIAAQYASY